MARDCLLVAVFLLALLSIAVQSARAAAAPKASKTCPKFTACNACPAEPGGNVNGVADHLRRRRLLADTTASSPASLSGVQRGDLLAHPSLADKKAGATLLNPSQRSTSMTLSKCCNLCSGNSKCAYWTWRQQSSQNGRCSLYGADQCSANKKLASYPKWQPDVKSPVYSFKKCAPSSTKTGAGSGLSSNDGGGTGGSSGSGGSGSGTGSTGDSGGATVTRYNTTCPTFTCLAACPASTDLAAVTAADKPTFPGAFRGRLFATKSLATGPTLVEDAGDSSLNLCCEYAFSQWRNDVAMWSWEQKGSSDEGRCLLFSSQACSSQNLNGDDTGNLPGHVFDPTYADVYTFGSQC